jgi:hypothetical protein
MRLGHLAMPILLGVITMTDGSNASPLDEFHWKNRVLVVVVPPGTPLPKRNGGSMNLPPRARPSGRSS